MDMEDSETSFGRSLHTTLPQQQQHTKQQVNGFLMSSSAIGVIIGTFALTLTMPYDVRTYTCLRRII